MSIEFLRNELNEISALRENRKRVATIVLEDKNLIQHLVFLTFLVDDEVSIKASWILEWICTHDSIENILPYLDEFTTGLPKLKFDSAIRPCAKICEHLAQQYSAKNKNETQQKLLPKHIDKIVTTGFDWLITPQKIAVRAYTMNSLFLFGLEKDWIHPELKYLIETKIIHQSKGTKARGKQVLKLIEKHRKRHL